VSRGVGVAADTVAYQLTVTASTMTTTYGATSASFRASLVPPADDPGLNPANFYITVGSTNIGGSLTSTTPPYGLFASTSSTDFPAGQYAVVANYVSPNHGLLKSAPLTFTVAAAAPSFYCAASGSDNYPPSSQLTIQVFGTPQAGAFTATFTGPETLTSPVEQLNASAQFTVTAPSRPGVYTPTCSFKGSATLAPATEPFQIRTLTISAAHQVAGARLYTNPAPLQPNTPTKWEVVVDGVPGLPDPTGNVSLSFGGTTFMRQQVALGPGGIAVFSATSPSFDPQSGVWIQYTGDTNYASANIHVSAMTAAIPGTVAAGASPGAANTATSPSAQSPSAGASPSGTASASRGGPGSMSLALASTHPTVTNIWLGAGVAVAIAVLVGVFVVGLAVRRRRAAQGVSFDDESAG
jgi:hypothetical protein